MIQLSENFTVSFWMEFKNALSQASDEDSVSPAKVDRKIRLTLDEFNDRGSVFLFLSIEICIHFSLPPSLRLLKLASENT